MTFTNQELALAANLISGTQFKPGQSKEMIVAESFIDKCKVLITDIENAKKG